MRNVCEALHATGPRRSQASQQTENTVAIHTHNASVREHFSIPLTDSSRGL